MTFLCLSCIPQALYLLGELFKFSYQALIDEAERFHLVRVGLHHFYCVRRPIVRVAWRILHPWRIGVAPASALIPSVIE